MTERTCTCGHTVGQHELRGGGLLGCYIWGCLCVDFTEGCPPGGDHVWTDDVGPEHEGRPAAMNAHCDECGASLPPRERAEP